MGSTQAVFEKFIGVFHLGRDGQMSVTLQQRFLKMHQQYLPQSDPKSHTTQVHNNLAISTKENIMLGYVKEKWIILHKISLVCILPGTCKTSVSPSILIPPL